jgi:hypothetical protein
MTLAIAPPYLVPLGIAGFALPLITNTVVTTLIGMRIWHFSPRKVGDMRSAQFRTGRATIEIVVESGMLYLAVQFVFVVLFAIRHPAQGIVGVIAVQIYVRVPLTLKGEKSLLKPDIFPPQKKNYTGHRTDTDSRPRGSRLIKVKYAVLWADSQWSCNIVHVTAYVVNPNTYCIQHGRIHGCWLAHSCRGAHVRNQIEADQWGPGHKCYLRRECYHRMIFWMAVVEATGNRFVMRKVNILSVSSLHDECRSFPSP